MKISKFAALSGISRKLLIFYDKSGVLHPACIDPENGYRYYSYHQFETARVIAQLREAAVPLEAIRDYLSVRTPDRLIELLDGQEAALAEQISRLQKRREMVQIRRAKLRQGLAEGGLTVRTCREQNLLLGPPLPDEPPGTNPWKHLPQFYDFSIGHGVPWGLPVGVLVERERLETGDWRPSRYFFHLPRGAYPAWFTRPAGTYVIGTAYGPTVQLYRRILGYIERHGYEICGNSYGEYLISVADAQETTRHLTQISVHVKKTDGGSNS